MEQVVVEMRRTSVALAIAHYLLDEKSHDLAKCPHRNDFRPRQQQVLSRKSARDSLSFWGQ